VTSHALMTEDVCEVMRNDAADDNNHAGYLSVPDNPVESAMVVQ